MSTCLSQDEFSSQISKILIIYTGGTIGMKPSPAGYIPEENYLENALRKMPILYDEEFANSRRGQDQCVITTSAECLYLPISMTNIRIIYEILEYTPLIDSSDMEMEHWVSLAKDIKKYYEYFDGFVILHGTDTMAYSASALSFMLEFLGKPVIFTGAQVPIFEQRSDGRENLLGALYCAGHYCIPEVMVFFRSKLFRGNRVTKSNSSSYFAFDSPNMKPLADIDVDITVNWNAVWRSNIPERNFSIVTNLESNIVLIRFYPGISIDLLKNFFLSPTKGAVLQTFGNGNVPNSRPDVMNLIKDASERGVIIINCTQCYQGCVKIAYPAAKKLESIGCISGGDMTPEAAFTKLSYVLALDILLEEKRELLKKNLRGEKTIATRKHKLPEDEKFFRDLGKAFKMDSGEQIALNAIMPFLMCTAAADNNVDWLENLRKSDCFIGWEDYNHLSPLHFAASRGCADAVAYLIQHRADIHAKDSNNYTPLICAIKNRNSGIIKLLRDAGAHLSFSLHLEHSAQTCRMAHYGDVQGLKLYHEAGADLNWKDIHGFTPLLVACDKGSLKVVEYLLTLPEIDLNILDSLGRTALDVARSRGFNEIVKKLESVSSAQLANT